MFLWFEGTTAGTVPMEEANAVAKGTEPEDKSLHCADLADAGRGVGLPQAAGGVLSNPYGPGRARPGRGLKQKEPKTMDAFLPAGFIRIGKTQSHSY